MRRVRIQIDLVAQFPDGFAFAASALHDVIRDAMAELGADRIEAGASFAAEDEPYAAARAKRQRARMRRAAR